MVSDPSRKPFDPEDDDAVSALDELPLWAAPFGLLLLDLVRLRPGLAVLDVGFGTGFPILELAMRLGPSSSVHGLDAWPAAHRRTRFKLAQAGLGNVTLHEGAAEEMPFADRSFDVVVSNNGYNNVEDREQAWDRQRPSTSSSPAGVRLWRTCCARSRARASPWSKSCGTSSPSASPIRPPSSPTCSSNASSSRTCGSS